MDLIFYLHKRQGKVTAGVEVVRRVREGEGTNGGLSRKWEWSLVYPACVLAFAVHSQL